MKGLTPRKQYQIGQVAATMAIEDMQLDRQAYENLVQLAEGAKTADQLINGIIEEYANG